MATAQIPFEDIEFHEGIKNPRDELKDIEDLAASIRSVGLQVPLTVLHVDGKNGVGGQKSDHYYLVVGFRRYEAIRRIRNEDSNAFRTVEAKRFKGSVAEAQVLNITENVQRSELSPLEVCRSVEILLNLGYKQKEVADKIGKSQSWVSNAIQFRRQATPQLRQAVQEGHISYGFARNIATLPDVEQIEQVGELITTVEQPVREAVVLPFSGSNGSAEPAVEPVSPEEVKVRKKVRESSGRIIRPSTAEARHEVSRRQPLFADGGGDDFDLGILVALEWMLGDRKTLQKP